MYRRIIQAACEPRPAQAQALARLLKQPTYPSLVTKLGLHASASLEDLRRAPVTDAEFMRPWLEQDWTSGQNVLAYAQTSGTTGRPKFIPVNRAYLAALRRFILRMGTCYMQHTGDYGLAFGGKTLNLSNRPCTELSPAGLPAGYISGIALQRAPWWVRRGIVPSPEVLQLADWNEKLKLTLEQALRAGNRNRIRSLGALPALGMYFIRYALDTLQVDYLSEVFPNLRVFTYSGEFLRAADQARIRTWVGPPGSPGTPGSNNSFYFFNSYSASEGQFGYALDPRSDALAFNSEDVVFQFQESETSAPCQLDEVEAGKKYRLLVTTPGGLINYWFGDWVEILSLRPLLFQLTGRDQDEISVSAEKINQGQLDRVLAQVRAASGLESPEYAVWLERGAINHLVWVIPGSASHPGLADQLDRELAAINDLFRDHLANGLLYRASEVQEAAPEVFTAYRQNQVISGSGKVRRIFPSAAEFARATRQI